MSFASPCLCHFPLSPAASIHIRPRSPPKQLFLLYHRRAACSFPLRSFLPFCVSSQTSSKSRSLKLIIILFPKNMFACYFCQPPALCHCSVDIKRKYLLECLRCPRQVSLISVLILRGSLCLFDLVACTDSITFVTELIMAACV